MRKKLADSAYDLQIQRLSNLRGFPHLPRSQQDLRRAMRRVTEVDATFLHRVISEIVDAGGPCPTPHELYEKASELRRQGGGQGKPDCPDCHGTGWVRGTRMVSPAGYPPYEADYSKRCACVTGAVNVSN